VDLLITECTFMERDADKAEAHGHLTARQAGQIAHEAEAGTLLLTHFSQRYGPDADFAAEARALHPDVFQLKDRDTYELKRQKP